MTDSTYLPNMGTGTRRRLFTDDVLMLLLEDIASGKNIAVAVSERGFAASQYVMILSDLRTRFPQELEDARVAGAQVMIAKAGQDLSPEDDGYWKQPHQIALLIERSKHHKWLATRLDPSLSDSGLVNMRPTAAAMVTGKIEPTEVLNPTDAYRMMLEGPK